MQIVDIYSGIGGFSLAGRWMGWKTVQFCEIEPFCQKVLSYHFPNVPIHGDIKTLTAEQIINNGLYNKKETTILVGGVPCQPWSTAGKRLGKDDNRDLWHESIALVGELQPDFVVFENVRGLVNWNGGLVFDEVQSDLEAEGYEVTPLLLPACGVNAPHRRDRIWFIAHRHGVRLQAAGPKQQATRTTRSGIQGTTSDPCNNGCSRNKESKEGCNCNREGISLNESDALHGAGITPNSDSIRQQRPGRAKHTSNKTEVRDWKKYRAFDALRWPTQPPVCSGNDGISPELVGITVSKHRKESIKGYGNAVVPQLVYQIFKTIQEYELRSRRNQINK